MASPKQREMKMADAVAAEISEKARGQLAADAESSVTTREVGCMRMAELAVRDWVLLRGQGWRV
jgi:hypothetical protein